MKNIAIRRSGALGDVVLATPVLRRMRRENPDALIQFATNFNVVFRDNPHLSRLPPPKDMPSQFDLVDLDLAYEKRPNMHIVEAYMEQAFGDRGDPSDMQQELFFPRREILVPKSKRWVAVHAAKAGWSNRTLPSFTWMRVIDGLKDAGFTPILVGTERDVLPEGWGKPGVTTSFHSFDVLAQATLISNCCCFVGSDSGLLHVAGATDVPIVGVFTCALPRFRLPWRNGALGYNCMSVVPADLSCVGCLHRRSPPVTTESCEREDGDAVCVRAVTAESIVEMVKWVTSA